MKVFVIGSGGREHALVWALARSPQVKEVYSATGNAGILKLTKPAAVNAGDVASIADFASAEKLIWLLSVLNNRWLMVWLMRWRNVG
jgi:phosphoribosylamine--glycine ligase